MYDASDLSIPEFLKIDSETRRTHWRGVKVKSAQQKGIVTRDCSEMLKKHRLRKLGAEERRLRKMVDELGTPPRDRLALNRLYAALKKVDDEIRRVG